MINLLHDLIFDHSSQLPGIVVRGEVDPQTVVTDIFSIINNASEPRRITEPINPSYVNATGDAYLAYLILRGPNPNSGNANEMLIRVGGSQFSNGGIASYTFTQAALDNIGIIIYNATDDVIYKVRISELDEDTTNPYTWTHPFNINARLGASNRAKVLLVDTSHDAIDWDNLVYQGDFPLWGRIPHRATSYFRGPNRIWGLVAEVLGGTPPYTFAWTNSSIWVTISGSDRQGIEATSLTNAGSLASTVFNVTVTDSDGAQVTDSVQFSTQAASHNLVNITSYTEDELNDEENAILAGQVLPLSSRIYNAHLLVSNNIWNEENDNGSFDYLEFGNDSNAVLWQSPGSSQDETYTINRSADLSNGSSISDLIRVKVRGVDTTPELTVDSVIPAEVASSGDFMLSGTWGTGGDNDTITLYGDSEAGGTFGTFTQNSDGTWSVVYMAPHAGTGNLAETLMMYAEDPAGNRSEPVEVNFTVLAAIKEIASRFNSFAPLASRVTPVKLAPAKRIAMVAVNAAGLLSDIEVNVLESPIEVNILTPPQRVEGGEVVELHAEVVANSTVRYKWRAETA